MKVDSIPYEGQLLGTHDDFIQSKNVIKKMLYFFYFYLELHKYVKFQICMDFICLGYQKY